MQQWRLRQRRRIHACWAVGSAFAGVRADSPARGELVFSSTCGKCLQPHEHNMERIRPCWTVLSLGDIHCMPDRGCAGLGCVGGLDAESRCAERCPVRRQHAELHGGLVGADGAPDSGTVCGACTGVVKCCGKRLDFVLEMRVTYRMHRAATGRGCALRQLHCQDLTSITRPHCQAHR